MGIVFATYGEALHIINIKPRQVVRCFVMGSESVRLKMFVS